MTQYSARELRIIAADSLGELNYNGKRCLLASLNENNPDAGKYADSLIKTVGVGVYNKLKAFLSDGQRCLAVAEAIGKRGVRCITIRSGLYPEELKNIPVPPLVLYARGNEQLLKGDKLAVVGSRRSTPQTIEECKKLCAQISARLTVVTGVADGADSAAIKGALATGRVICVLPGGHDSSCAARPSLLKMAEAKGLTLSEFPPLFRAQRYTFILRNRIIAGLSRGTLVVSAAKKSGALSTAAYAADYGRDVFAFPHSIGIASGEGCNALIKKGAYLAENALDILSVLGLELPVERKVQLVGEELAVSDFIRSRGEAHLAEIAQAAGIPLRQASTVCSSLELKGIIARTGGNKFSAV